MKLSELLIEIQRSLLATDASRVMAALRQDDLVWKAVQQTDLVSKLSRFVSRVEAWQPAFLALLALGMDPDQVDTFLKNKLSTPEEGLRNRAFQLYEETLQNGNQMSPATLVEAGLLALALRERWRLTESWSGLGKELFLNEKELAPVWKTAFACLVGMIPNQQPLLGVLLKEANFESAIEIISNVILSNPQTPGDRVLSFIKVLDDLPIAQQLTWLRLLNLRGQNELIIQLADGLLQTDLTDHLSLEEVDLERMEMDTLLKGAVSFQQLAGLYQLSGQPEKALPLLKRSQKASQHFLAGVNLQLLDVGAGEGSSEPFMTAFKQSIAALPESKLLQTEYVLAMDNNPHAKSFKKQLQLNVQNPFIEIQQAVAVAEEGDHVKAQFMARGAVKDLVDWFGQGDPFTATQFLYSWQPTQLIGTLINMELIPEALKTAEVFLGIRPNDYELVDLVSQLFDQVGDNENALNYSLIGLTFDNSNFKAHRRVAELLEAQGEYKPALDHRRKVLDLDKTPQLADWLACARCAFQSEDLLQVVDACNKVIKMEPDHSEANTMIGQSLYRLGDAEAAAPYLSHATVLSPAISQNWLMLAEVYEKSGDQQKMFETLRSAILSNPDSAEINYKLAQICLENGALSDALPFLRKAASLSPESVKLAIQLGETLRSMGHLAEARLALENARQKFPADPDLALLVARTMISLGESKAALPALEVVMQVGNPGFDEYMMYLKALLGEHLFPINPAETEQDLAKLMNAQQALEKALAISPEDFNARVLKAEVLAAKGSKEEAFEIYQSLIDHPNAASPDWQWRIYGGFGKVALDLKEIETALAVLKEATHVQPENVYLQRLLAEAYLVADLRDEAYQVAQSALRLAPTNLQNLAWFADIALTLNDEAEAIDALKCIVELDPDSAANWVKLADTQLKLGDVDEARKTLKSLLSLDHLEVEHWRQAAYVFLRLNDQVSALSCLEQATQLSPERAAELNFEVACLHKSLGSLEPALDVLQKAIEISPEERVLYVMQADLMADLNRNQAALACLEQALNLKDFHSTDQVAQFENALNHSIQLLPARWLEIAGSNAGIYIRLARLLRRMGNLQDALEQAEKAVEEVPTMLSYRYLAVDLAKSLLLNEKAVQLLNWFEDTNSPQGAGTLKSIEGQNADSWLALACQWAEQVLDSDEEVLAGRIVQQLIEISQDSARVMAAQSRMLVRQGQMQVAEEVIQKVVDTSSVLDNELYNGSIQDYSGIELISDCLRGRNLWLANALLDANHWDDALVLFAKSSQSDVDAWVNFEYARALVKVAEKQRLMSELKCVAHLPGNQFLTEENAACFEKAARMALNISNAPEAELWLLRGEVAFNPTPQNIHALDRRLEHNGDVAPLVAVMRQTGNIPAALTIAQRLRGTPEDLLEGALCLQDGHPDKGLLLCQKALETRSNNPLFNVAVALLSQKAGQTEKAFESLELALEAWQQEPEWHAWAAHLAKQVAPEKFMPHMKKAYEIQPTRVDYAFELGVTHLDADEPTKAIEILEKAADIAPERPGLWSALSQAYEQENRLNDAFRCAETATKLAPSSAPYLLMCGNLALKMGKGDVAVDYANAALDCAPKDEDVVVFASHVYTRQGHLKKGLNIIEKSLPNLADSFKVAYEYASLNRQINGSESGLEMVKDLASKYPQQADALTLLAEVEMDCDHTNEAKQAAFESLKINIEQPVLLLLLGRIMRQSGQLDQAIDYMSESIHLMPVHTEAYLELGETYQQRREQMQALHTYQQGIKVVPNEPALYYAAALVMRELKDYVGAESMLRRAAELSPQDLNIRRQLGAVIALNLVHNSQEVNSQL